MKKALKIVAISILVLLLILFITPYFFKDRIAQEVKKLADRQLTTGLNFSSLSVSFFSHFPNLTLNVSDFSVKAPAAFPGDTLVSAREISFGIDLSSLFGKSIRITRIYIDRARVNILYNEKGESSLNVFKSTGTETGEETKDTATSGMAEMKIEKIHFRDCRIVYADLSIPVKVVADGFDYSGTSAITADFLNLSSKININALDVVYDNVKYLDSKPVSAKLTTRINQKDLAIDFQKNDLKIKDIPLQFNGRFAFEKEGYQLNLSFLSVLEKEFLSARFKIRQSDKTWIQATVNASIDLGKWSRAFEVKTVDLRGMYDINFTAEGHYYSGPDPASMRKDTVLLCIPKFSLMTRLTDGYIKYHALPQALSSISFDLNAGCPDSNYRHAGVHLKNLQASFLKNQIKGFVDINSIADMQMEAALAGKCNLAELRQVVPIDSLDLEGMLSFDLNAKGSYSAEKKLFPVTTVTLDLQDGKIGTKYYPNPLEKIGMHAEITGTGGSMKDVSIKIDPLTFRFEGQTFTLNSSMRNLDDLEYNITAEGVIDLGKIYRVFSQKGTDLTGFIETKLSLKGRQSDAMAGRYERLKNTGTLNLRDISLTSELFPKPFLIQQGNFRFDQDRIWFDNFKVGYGSSDFSLRGKISNVVNYVLSKGGVLKGNFSLNSEHINADEFMAFAPADTTVRDTVASTESGVIIIPGDLDIVFRANVKTAEFTGVTVKDLKGEVDLKKGILLLREAGFDLIGCKTSMDATYGSVTPQSAFFDFHVKADNFDVKKAYNEIGLIRELSSAAGKAEGVVALDYALKGRLDGDMSPVMPSLEGGGTISVKKVKFYGLKLFNDISKGTEKASLKDPDFSRVEIRSKIKNNTVTLERFKFKVKGIRVRIEGTSTFDSRLNMKVRIGLGPLGIIGIPIKVSGTMDNLKIKYGRGKENEEIPDSAYRDQLPKEMLDRLRSVKEDTTDVSPE